ncbi:PIGG [Branchiostoma lanceolatum]|uniref:PIGG protein n=1 Tax=Branchiostoma lanceolatum TaxID=7740 RepID=A0A8K0EB56_BRALA|nr:PIGG [Branchiostoma lanceolatum]
MYKSHTAFLLACLVTQVLGVVIFLKGFIPIKNAVPGYATLLDLPPEPWENNTADYKNHSANSEDSTDVPGPPLPPIFGRLVIMLVDAMRADFMYGDSGKNFMPYTRALVDSNSSVSFIAKAHPPTVTMPRIKGLTTGSIPGFVDIALNLDSKALVEDNVITQMYHAGRRMVFYGDDTWLKLFPDHFVRHDGTTSFFVTDYTEVDENVTRHVVPELSRPDWDVMILHYLGLDHIGHLAGPASSLIGPKLQEMDKIVETIHTTVMKQDSERDLPTLLVLCGDHGMSNAGSHGGASAPETLTTLVFLSSLFSGGKGSNHVTSPVYQTGLAPTLALTFGLPVPQNSLGQVMTPVLARSSAQDQLRAVQINAHQLVGVLRANVAGFEREPGYQLYQQAVKMHSGWLKALAHGESATSLETLGQRVSQQYSRAMESIVDRVAASLSEYDMHAMVVGIALLIQVFFILLAASGKFVAGIVPGTDTWTVYIPPPALLLSSFFLVLSAQVSLCTSTKGWASAELCSGSAGWFMSLAAVTSTSVCVSLTIQLLFLTDHKTLLSAVGHSLHMCCSLPWEAMFLPAGVMLHSVSLGSSSLVEEEHQTWYFLQTTLFFLFMMANPLQTHKRPITCDNTTTARSHLDLVQDTDDTENDIMYKQRRAFSDGKQKDDGRNVKKTTEKKSSQLENNAPSECGSLTQQGYVRKSGCMRKMVAVLALLLTSRLLRSWNQTGIVWADQPDIGDWFVRPHNATVLAVTVFQQYILHELVLPWTSLYHSVPLLTLVHVWMGQAAFFFQGNSNSIATIDISAGYVGMEDYVQEVAGTLTCLSTYAGPFLWFTSLLVLITKRYPRPYPAMLQACFTIIITRTLPVTGYTVITTLQRYHLFVWSVFSPKLLYEAMLTALTATVVVDPAWFAGMKRLMYMNLGANKLKRITPSAFQNPALMCLDLGGNDLSQLDKAVLGRLLKLSKVHISSDSEIPDNVAAAQRPLPAFPHTYSTIPDVVAAALQPLDSSAISHIYCHIPDDDDKGPIPFYAAAAEVSVSSYGVSGETKQAVVVSTLCSRPSLAIRETPVYNAALKARDHRITLYGKAPNAAGQQSRRGQGLGRTCKTPRRASLPLTATDTYWLWEIPGEGSRNTSRHAPLSTLPNTYWPWGIPGEAARYTLRHAPPFTVPNTYWPWEVPGEGARNTPRHASLSTLPNTYWPWEIPGEGTRNTPRRASLPLAVPNTYWPWEIPGEGARNTPRRVPLFTLPNTYWPWEIPGEGTRNTLRHAPLSTLPNNYCLWEVPGEGARNTPRHASLSTLHNTYWPWEIPGEGSRNTPRRVSLSTLPNTYWPWRTWRIPGEGTRNTPRRASISTLPNTYWPWEIPGEGTRNTPRRAPLSKLPNTYWPWEIPGEGTRNTPRRASISTLPNTYWPWEIPGEGTRNTPRRASISTLPNTYWPWGIPGEGIRNTPRLASLSTLPNTYWPWDIPGEGARNTPRRASLPLATLPNTYWPWEIPGEGTRNTPRRVSLSLSTPKI